MPVILSVIHHPQNHLECNIWQPVNMQVYKAHITVPDMMNAARWLYYHTTASWHGLCKKWDPYIVRRVFVCSPSVEVCPFHSANISLPFPHHHQFETYGLQDVPSALKKMLPDATCHIRAICRMFQLLPLKTLPKFLGCHDRVWPCIGVQKENTFLEKSWKFLFNGYA
jgi:hypothetical protein